MASCCHSGKSSRGASFSAARNSSSVTETTSPVVRLRKEDCSSDWKSIPSRISWSLTRRALCWSPMILLHSRAHLPCLPPPIPIRPFTGRHTCGWFEVLSRVVRYREQRCLANALWDTQDRCCFLLVAEMERCPCGPHSTSTERQHQRPRRRQNTGIGSRSRPLHRWGFHTGDNQHRDFVHMLCEIGRRLDQAWVRLTDLCLSLWGICLEVCPFVESS